MCKMHRKMLVMGLVLAVAMLAAPAMAAKQKLVVSVMSHAGIPIVKATQAEMFEKLHPDVDVEIVTKSAADALVLIASGSQLDAAYLAYDSFRSYVSQGIFKDITPFIQREPGLKDAYFPIGIDACTWKGKTYCWTESSSASGLFYNKTMFDTYGLQYPKDLDWDQLLSQSRKLTGDTNGDRQIDQWGVDGRVTLGMSRWIWQAGGQLFDEDFTKCFLGESAAIKGMQFLYDLSYLHHVAPTIAELMPYGDRHRGAEKLFRLGKIGMLYSTRYYSVVPEESIQYDWDIAPLARGPAGRQDGYANDFLGIISTSKNVDLAWEFIKFCTSTDIQVQLQKLHGDQSVMAGIPSNIRAARTLLVDSSKTHNEAYWIEAMADAVPSSTKSNPPAPASGVYGTWANRVQNVTTGAIPNITNMMISLAAEVNAALAEVKR